MQSDSQPLHSPPSKPLISNLPRTQLSFSPLMQPLLHQKYNKKLRTPSAIKNLTLDFEGSAWALSNSLPKKFFRMFLKDFRDLESLKITRISFKNSPVLIKVLRNYRGLKNLEIIFTRVAALFPQGDYLENFISALYRFSPRLAQLKLALKDDLPSTTYREDYFGSQLRIWKIKKLSNLQKLTIHFPISVFMSEKKIKKGSMKSSVKYMDLSALKRFSKLQSLDIAMIQQQNDQYLQYDTTELYFDPNKLFPNVKKFTWCVISSRAKKVKELDIIGPQIASQLRRLNDFGIIFRKDFRETAIEIRESGEYLATLNKDLTRLSLVHNSEELPQEDASVLISEFSSKSLQRLSVLSLEFRNCRGIKNAFLVDLAQLISRNLTELRSLRLSFESEKQQKQTASMAFKAIFGYNEISDKGLKQFASILSRGCEKLEFLSLEFERYSKISNEGVKSLSRKLKKLKRLKGAWIRFFDCVGVTEKGCQEAMKSPGAAYQESQGNNFRVESERSWKMNKTKGNKIGFFCCLSN